MEKLYSRATKVTVKTLEATRTTSKAIDVFQLGRSEPKGGGKPHHKDYFHLSDYPRDQ